MYKLSSYYHYYTITNISYYIIQSYIHSLNIYANFQ